MLPPWGFPNGSDVKESANKVGDLGLILNRKDAWRERMSDPLQYSVWRIPWDCKGRIRLSD